MRTIRQLSVLTALCAVVTISGCGGAQGPVTLGNLFGNYPPQPRGVAVNIEASLVVVDFQPRDADVWIEGWFTIPSDPDGVSKRRIEFTENMINGLNTRTGRAQFVIASFEWPSGWGGNAIRPGVSYFFMVTIKDPDGRRVSVTVWKFANGAVTQVS